MNNKVPNDQVGHHWGIIGILLGGALVFYILVIQILSSDTNDRINKLVKNERRKEK